MKIIKDAIAGTLESCDIQIMIMDKEADGIRIELKSSVEKQFGRQIRKVIEDTLVKFGIENASVVAVDKGALDCTIKARMECAIHRACGMEQKLEWEVID
jgi:citrate lyase subunit gamma (acyl carrier protein)